VQYHELRITFEFEDQANLAGIGTTALEATLWCDYVDRYAYNSRTPEWFEDLPFGANVGKSSGFSLEKTLYNLLVNFVAEIGNTPGCGNLLRALSTKPFGKPKVSRQGNDLAYRNNERDWTIRSIVPKHVMKVYGTCPETAKVCAGGSHQLPVKA